MSLFNKMLQDLDARGGGSDAALEEQALKAVPATERDRRPLLLAGAGAAVVVLAAGGWFGWQYWKSHSVPPGPVPKVIDNRIPDRPRFQEPPAEAAGTSSSAAAASVAAANATAGGPAGVGATTGATAGTTTGTTTGGTAAAASDPASPAALAADGAHGHAVAEARSGRAAPAADADALAGGKGKRAALGAGAEAAVEAKPKRQAAVARLDAAVDGVPAQPRSRKSAAAANAAQAHAAVSDLTPKQVAENTYRRGLASLQEGRVTSALADLEKAIEIDPRNDAARQTYVSLLLENKRTDDAIRQLRLALGIDPRQPGLAMVLARLQLEKGGPALQTLLTTLPYAGNSAEYHGFLAGVLQREHRNDEAAQHYRDALRLSPNNGVWWMGLGISLQAGQHLPEARDAYTRARSAAGLTPELQAFIDRKLEQLSR